MTPREVAGICDRILETKKFRDYPGARNGLQVGHGRPVKKIGWAVDADLESIQRAGKAGVNFLVVHHGIFWGDSTLDRRIRTTRIREAKRLGVAIYSSHLPLDAHPEIGNSTGLVRALGLDRAKRKPFGVTMGRPIGWKVALLRSRTRRSRGHSFEGLGGMRISDLAPSDLPPPILKSASRGVGSPLTRGDLTLRIADLKKRGSDKVRRWEGVKVIPAGPAICRKIGIVTGGFGDLDQVTKAGLDTLVTGEADYPTEVKARELGINLILAGHYDTEIFGAQALAEKLAVSLSLSLS